MGEKLVLKGATWLQVRTVNTTMVNYYVVFFLLKNQIPHPTHGPDPDWSVMDWFYYLVRFTLSNAFQTEWAPIEKSMASRLTVNVCQNEEIESDQGPW